MEPIRAKAGDAIRIEKQLTTGDERTNNPVDLTGETVRVYIQFGEDALVANQEVEYVDRASGKVAVELSPSQTSNIGRHNIEWVVDPQGDPTTFPDSDYDILRTVSPLDRELTPSEETPPDLTVTNLTVNDTATVDTLDAGSVNAGNADIGGLEANTHLGRVYSDDFGTTAIDISDVPTNALIQIRGVNVITSFSSWGLTLRPNGDASGDYNYSVSTDGLTGSRVTGDDKFVLIEETSENSQTGVDYYITQTADFKNREVLIWGDAVDQNAQKETLREGDADFGDVDITSLVFEVLTDGDPRPGGYFDVIAVGGESS
mgnify:CR=1 FL=1